MRRPACILFALLSVLTLAVAASAQKGQLRPPPELDATAAAAQGRALVADLLSRPPAENYSSRGTLKIRGADGFERATPIRFFTRLDEDAWTNTYEAGAGGDESARLVVAHRLDQDNAYTLQRGAGAAVPLRGHQTMTPFAGSDFWAADLGLEFLHWPDQRLLRQQMRRGRSCNVLESRNPEPVPGAYRRVVAWIDIESGGIVHADAYDFKDELLKQFDPKEFKKVRGQWQLEEMEIRNRQTGGRSRIEFNLPK